MTPYILIMEDEDALGELLKYNLEKEGYRVVLADDGDEGLLQIDEQLPDLLAALEASLKATKSSGSGSKKKSSKGKK